MCKIEDSGGRPLFVVTVIERGAEQMVFREYSCRGISFVKLFYDTLASEYLPWWLNMFSVPEWVVILSGAWFRSPIIICYRYS